MIIFRRSERIVFIHSAREYNICNATFVERGSLHIYSLSREGSYTLYSLFFLQSLVVSSFLSLLRPLDFNLVVSSLCGYINTCRISLFPRHIYICISDWGLCALKIQCGLFWSPVKCLAVANCSFGFCCWFRFFTFEIDWFSGGSLLVVLDGDWSWLVLCFRVRNSRGKWLLSKVEQQSVSSQHDGGHVKRWHMQSVSVRGSAWSTALPSLHMYGQHQVDTPGMSGPVDEVLQEGVLRTVRISLLLHSNLQSGYAQEIASERCDRGPVFQCCHSCEVLAALHFGGHCLARNCTAHGVQNLQSCLQRFFRPCTGMNFLYIELNWRSSENFIIRCYLTSFDYIALSIKFVLISLNCNSTHKNRLSLYLKKFQMFFF